MGDRTQQTTDRAVQLPGEGRLCQGAPVPASIVIFFIDVSHQDRLLNRQDQVRLFTYLGDHLEGMSDGLRGEDEDRANDYRALAGRFRRVASVH